MKRPSSPGTIGGRYVDGNPFDLESSAIFESSDPNTWIDELEAIVLASGRTLDPNDNAQVIAAIQDLIEQKSRRRRQLRAQARAGASTLDSFGMGTLTLFGTATYLETATGPHLKLATSGTLNEDCGVRSDFSLLQRRWDPDWELYWQFGVQTNTRQWHGLVSADPMTLTDPASIHVAAFRFESGVDNGGGGGDWKSVTSNGTSSTVKSTGVAATPATQYRFRVRHAGGGRFEFYINDQLVSVHDNAASEFVPSTSTPLAWQNMGRHTIAGGGAKDVRLSYCAILTD